MRLMIDDGGGDGDVTGLIGHSGRLAVCLARCKALLWLGFWKQDLRWMQDVS